MKPGQEWSREITKAIGCCDAIVVCLSPRSITKEGFVQKEIALAVDVAQEKLADTIFLIPVLLEECEIPDKLKHLQAAQLFALGGYESLVAALRDRKTQRDVRQDFRKQLKAQSSQCFVESSPFLLRRECITELISDITLSLDNVPISIRPAGPLHLYLNTSITNRVNGDVTDILLIYPGATDTPSVAIGRLISSNRITFDSVTISANVRPVLTIRGLRVNANALADTRPNGHLNAIVATLKFGAAPPIGLSEPIAYVRPRPSFSFRSQHDVLTLRQSISCDGFKVAVLVYSETFLAALKTRALMNITSDITWQAVSTEERRCRVQTTESVAESIVFGCSDLTICGLANCGSRLSASFFNLPSGVRLFDSVNATNASDRIVATLTKSRGGPFSQVVGTVQFGEVRAIELPIVNGWAEAVWELVARDNKEVGVVEFQAFVSFEPDQKRNSPALGIAAVLGGLGPAGFSTNADPSSPVPRL